MTPLLKTFLRLRVPGADSLDLGIHPEDEMLHYLIDLYNGDWDRAAVAYVESGLQVHQMTSRFLEWRFGGTTEVEFLDFASGYGRVTRHLLRALGPAHLVVSDVMREAVAFQSQYFDVEGVVSSTKPADFHYDRSFSCVQAISLFSHLPERMFRAWIARLWALVEPGGLLIFSVHDRSLSGDGRSRGDFLFAPESENQLLDPGDYGTAWVTESFVSRALRQEINDYSYCRFPRGLANYQDVYLVVREREVDFSGLVHSSGIDGHIDYADFGTEGTLRCFGWAAHLALGDAIEKVCFQLNDEILASTTEFLPRHDVANHFGDKEHLMSGWDLEIKLPDGISFGSDIVMVNIVSNHGEERILHIGCVHSLVAEAARKNLSDTRAELEVAKAGSQ